MAGYIINKYPSLAAVVHIMVKNAPSGLDVRSIAEFTGKPYPTLMNELTRQEGHKLGADLLLPLMDVCGSDAPMRFLAREMGGVYLPIPHAAPEGESGLLKSLANSIKEFGDFACETAADLADGDLPREQFDRIQKEGQESVEAIMGLLRMVRATHEAQYGPGKNRK